MTHEPVARDGRPLGGLPPNDGFLADVLTGLGGRPKSIPSKYFYDAHGSRLFEEITTLEEYYPTRTELAIMEKHLEEIVDRLGRGCLLVEYGSGSSRKTRILLDAMEDPAGYVPIDISGEHLAESARCLAEAYPDLSIHPVSADYTTDFEIPALPLRAARTVVYFPGSTIGNVEPSVASSFLGRMARVAGWGGGLLIGVDLEKNPSTLEAAYNDARGVTAAFNRNLIHRINAELGASFDVDAFAHEAVYNRSRRRIEMYLISGRKQSSCLRGHVIALEEGERILTEYSYKYTRERFADVARRAGLRVRDVWMDDDRFFSVQYLEAIRCSPPDGESPHRKPASGNGQG